MKDLLKNKKTLIPILIGIAIIVVAIIAFIVIAIGKKSNGRVTTISLDNTQPTSNALGNTYPANNVINEVDNEVDNEIDNTVDNTIDNDIDFDVDEFYQDAVKQFVAGYQDEDEMQKFIDDYFDPKAFAAYYNIEGDESAFWNEYMNLSDDDEKINEVKETLLSLHENVEALLAVDSNDDIKVILKDISDPEQSNDDESITSVIVTIGFGELDEKVEMVFYKEVVIYIKDENGNSILD